jgi:hypothetical protein
MTRKIGLHRLTISRVTSFAETCCRICLDRRLQRTVNPTLYSRTEIDKRILDGNAFVKRVLAQPKLWVIGEGRGLAK